MTVYQPTTSKTTQFFQKVGGRKQFNGYLATDLLTLMAFVIKPNFSEYSFGILGALGLTSGLIALEDRDQKKYSKKTEISTVTTDTRQNGSDSQLRAMEVVQLEGADSSHN